MIRTRFRRPGSALVIPALAAICLTVAAQTPAGPKPDQASRQLGRSIFKELIEINTADSKGSVTKAAEAMRSRLLAAGFPATDLVLAGPSPTKQNLVARYRAKPGSTKKPMLIIGHLDVVEAERSDWTVDPFVFLEKDGYFYGRGTQDMKDNDAIIVTDLIRLKKAGFQPDRDIILALTAGEESGRANGADWLTKNRRDLIDAEFAINPDSGGINLNGGKPTMMLIEATEKLYGDFQITATNRGGHSSLPRPDNAIYELMHGLDNLEKSPFPFELNEVTRAYYTKEIELEPAKAPLIRRILATPMDKAAAEELAKNPLDNATLRTTCVATMLKGGHAPNALPGSAEANVNCRILPGYSQEDVRLQLAKIFDDPQLAVKSVQESGEILDHGTTRKALPPPPLNPSVMQPLERVTHAFWPGLIILPEMEVGASDSVYTMAAGIPSYGISGVAIEEDDMRMHGRDERLPVESFYAGLEFYYQLLQQLTGGK